MNEIVIKFLLTGDKFMLEMHLRQPGFTYSACAPFTKNKEEYKNLKKQEIPDIFIKANQIKHVFNITRRTVSDQIMFDKAFNITKNPKDHGYQDGLASTVHNFF